MSVCCKPRVPRTAHSPWVNTPPHPPPPSSTRSPSRRDNSICDAGLATLVPQLARLSTLLQLGLRFVCPLTYARTSHKSESPMAQGGGRASEIVSGDSNGWCSTVGREIEALRDSACRACDLCLHRRGNRISDAALAQARGALSHLAELS